MRHWHLALPAQQPLVLGLGVLGAAVDERLDFVELVHRMMPRVSLPEARFAAEAGRPTRITQRPGGQVENLSAWYPASGTSRCRRGEIVARKVVDLLGVVPAYHLGPHQHRRIISVKPLSQATDGQLKGDQLRPGAAAGEEVEPRPRHFGTALDVDRPSDSPSSVVGGVVDRGRFADDVGTT